MAQRSVAMSTRKTDFAKALDLDFNKQSHRQLYQLMNEETEVVWEQLVADPSNRRPHAQHKEEPYSYGDFTEMAIDNALQTIAQNASPDTRPFFEGDPSPNGDRYWIARWILYHIFRNRDARNRSRSRTTRAGTRQSRQSSARGSSVESNDNGSRRKASLTPTIPKGYLTSTPSPANAGPSGRETDVEPARQEIYDPVRDR